MCATITGHYTRFSAESSIFLARPGATLDLSNTSIVCLMSRMLLGHSGLEHSISDTDGECIHNFFQPPPPRKNKILDVIIDETKTLKLILKNQSKVTQLD